ncbi:MAG: redoxin domain-containing protein [Planctomycetota bacterium]
MLENLQSMLESALASGSLLVYPLLLGVGVLASFTPCTYPVIPITVGYIGAASNGRRGVALGLSLALVLGLASVYAILGVVFAAMGMTFGAVMGSGPALAGIALFFVLMALFLLDVFSFPTLAYLGRLQGGERRKGVAGAFVTGAVSGLVVGPCTGPILFAVIAFVVATLEGAETTAGYAGQALSGGLKLFVFGLGQGALIVLSGVFAGFLTRLPKSGAWLNGMKKGFALLILFGAGLLLLHAGAVTGFDPLGRMLVSLEPTEERPPSAASSGQASRTTAGPVADREPVAAAAAPDADVERPPLGTEPGQSAPAFTLTTQDGESFSLADQRGQRGVVLVFFATWCPSCMAEVPSVKRLAETAAAGRVRVLGVNYRQASEVVHRFIEERKVNYDVLLDADGAVAQAYAVHGIPLVVGIDADGVVRYREHHIPEGFDAFLAMLSAPLTEAVNRPDASSADVPAGPVGSGF